MKEDNNFVSRVKRYSQVTTSLTSLATKFAGKKYLNFDLSIFKNLTASFLSKLPMVDPGKKIIIFSDELI